MSENSDNPTPDEKEYSGSMTKEEYEKQPESNTGATVERDIDPPNPKYQEETHADKVSKKQNDKLNPNTKPGVDPDE